MKYYSRKIIVCTLLVFALVLGASAATLREMQENGAVSDGGISYGDARDGIVSDVSDKGESILPDLNGTNDMHGGSSAVSPDVSHNTSDGSMLDGIGAAESTRDTSSAASSTTAGDTQGNGNSGRGMSAGLIIAILVVVAVVVIIFILLPKKR